MASLNAPAQAGTLPSHYNDEPSSAFEGIVAVVDDDVQVRNSIALWLRTKGFVTRSFATARELLIWLTPETAAVIVADVRMPQMDGIALLQALVPAECRQPVILMTGQADVPLAVQAMKAGAAEFLQKPFTPETLVASVLTCSSRMLAAVAAHSRRITVQRRLLALSQREREVLDLLVDGLSNKAIGGKLLISPRTVEIHRARVMSKMEAESVPDLVKMTLHTRAI